MLIFIISHLYFKTSISSTQTLALITSKEFNSHIKQHFMQQVLSNMSPMAFKSVKSWGHLRPNNMLFGRLQPKCKIC